MAHQKFKENKLDASVPKAWAEESIGAAKTAYEMSMPLLANPSLLAKEAKRFELLLKETTSEAYKKDSNKQWMTSEEFRLWMRGRQLLVTIKSGNAVGAAEIAQNMQATLKSELYNPQGEAYGGLNTAFACWSLGYLIGYYALHDKAAYDKNKDALKKAIAYQQKYYGKQNGPDLSDAMWSYAMAIQASAWAGKDEKASHQYYMQGLAKLTGEDSTPAASIKKLPDDQFPAWLASIVHGSALLMGHPQPAPISLSMEEARKRSTKEQDKMLSISTQVDYLELSAAKAKVEDSVVSNAEGYKII